MAGRLYWEKLRPLVPAAQAAVDAAFAADTTLKMYALHYYRHRFDNARASMGYTAYTWPAG